MFRHLSLFVIVFSFSLLCQAQKVKYKDVYEFIQTEQYNQANQQLRIFMADPKNADHANGNLQMGRMYQRLIIEADIFSDWDNIQTYTDSSKIFFAKATALIDEKEVKKNDEFYTEFEKRDLRTGKLSVKLFDIQFAIEDYVSWVNSHFDAVENVNIEAKNLQEQYQKITESYQAFISNKKNIEELFLQAGLQTISNLETLAKNYDKFKVNYDTFKKHITAIQGVSLSIELAEKEISDPFNLSPIASDFTLEKSEVYNFGYWGSLVREKIVREILPLKNDLLSYDSKLENVLSELKGGKKFTAEQMASLTSNQIKAQLLPFDKNPIPSLIFDLRLAEINYYKTINSQLIPDSLSSIGGRIDAYKQRILNLEDILKSIELLASSDIDAGLKNYKDFIDQRFNGFTGLDAFLKEKKNFSETLLFMYRDRLKDNEARNAFVMVNGSIRIPIELNQKQNNTKYHPFETKEEYSLGLFNEGVQKNAYWVELNPERTTSFYYTAGLDSILNTHNDLLMLSQADATGKTVFIVIYSNQRVTIKSHVNKVETSKSIPVETNDTTVPTEAVSEVGIPLNVIKIDKSTGVIWNNFYVVEQPPTYIQFTQQGGLIINMNAPANEGALFLEILTDGSKAE